MKKLWKTVSALCVVYTVYDIYTTSHKKYKHAKKPVHFKPDDTCQGTKEPELHGETTVKVENGKPTEAHSNWDETSKKIKAELEKQKELLNERKDRIEHICFEKMHLYTDFTDEESEDSPIYISLKDGMLEAAGSYKVIGEELRALGYAYQADLCNDVADCIRSRCTRIDDLIEEILRKEDQNYEPDSEE